MILCSPTGTNVLKNGTRYTLNIKCHFSDLNGWIGNGKVGRRKVTDCQKVCTNVVVIYLLISVPLDSVTTDQGLRVSTYFQTSIFMQTNRIR
jgi:hypothetical protein